MATERYNGIKINMETATDDEVMGVLDHSMERMHRAEEDVQRAMGHAASRGLIPKEELAQVIPFPLHAVEDHPMLPFEGA